MRNELLRAGVECKADDAMLSQLRRLSSRQTTVDVLQRLDAKGVDIPAMPKVCHSSKTDTLSHFHSVYDCHKEAGNHI